MAITINSTRENDNDQTVFFSFDYNGEKSWHGDIPKDADPQEWFDAIEDKVKCGTLRKQYPEADVPQLEDKTALESFEAWIAGGAKNAELKKTTVTPAQPAVDAVLGERQVVVESEVEEEVSTTEIVEVDGKFIEQTVTETVTKTVSTPQVTEHQLYNEDGTPQTRVVTAAVEAKDAVVDEDGNELEPAVEAVEEVTEPVLHSVPVLVEYEISPAVEAVEESSETVVVRAESVVEKVAWKDTSE